MKTHTIEFALVALGLLSHQLVAAENADSGAQPILCQGEYQTEAQAVEQLARMAATYSNLDEWRARAAAIRKQIRVGANSIHCRNAPRSTR